MARACPKTQASVQASRGWCCGSCSCWRPVGDGQCQFSGRAGGASLRTEPGVVVGVEAAEQRVEAARPARAPVRRGPHLRPPHRSTGTPRSTDTPRSTEGGRGACG
jgi:hypothetical protein